MSSENGCEGTEQRFYANPSSGAQREMLNKFVHVPKKTEGREEVRMWTARLLYRCSVRKESDGNELSLVRCVVHATTSSETNKTLKYVCPEGSALGSGKNRDTVATVGKLPSSWRPVSGSEKFGSRVL